MEKLIERVKAILLTPATEWQVIAREGGEPSDLFTHYVAILALIPALARFIGTSLIGGYTPVIFGLIGAVFSYVLSFAVVYVVRWPRGSAPRRASPTRSSSRSIPIRRRGSPAFSCSFRA